MIKDITISKINHTNKVSKAGKSYISCGIMVTSPSQVEYWLNGFGDDITKSFAVGQTVELEVYEDDYGWKFKVPAGTEIKPVPTSAPTSNLEERLKTLELRVLFLEGKDTTTYDINALKGANTASEAMMEAETKPGETIIENDDGSITKMPF